MLKILVTGAGGQLGRSIQKLSYNFPDIEFYFKYSAEINICDHSALNKIFDSKNFDYCINCAAYTQVDKAESNIENAKAINSEAVASLSKICNEKGVVLIHISTDFVFDGTQNLPYKETDTPNPKSVYGDTKLAGENAIIQNSEQFFIIRTSWLYSEFGYNFVKSMLKYGAEKAKLSVVYDQIGTPTFAEDLAKVILQIITLKSTNYGIYHYSNEGVASWYDFAYNVFRLSGSKCELLPILSKDYPTPAKRPSYSVLDKYKIKANFDIEIPHWLDSLNRALKNII